MLALLVLVVAMGLSACGGGDDATPVAGPGTTLPNDPNKPVALGNPTLTFTPPQESLDLANYTLVSRTTLPVNLVSGANQIAAEVSAVTYNEATDSLFIIGDEGTYITQLSKAGAVIDSMTLPAGLFADPEGLTAIGNNQFVVANERLRTANLLTYRGGTTLDANTVKTIKLGTTVGNIGLEGVSFDPLTRGYVFVKEKEPQAVFQTTLDFAAGTASNGSASTENSANLFDPALAGVVDLADVHALSNTLPSTAPDYSHLMLLSQESGRIVKTDRQGRIYSRLDLLNAPLDLGHEGLTFDKQLNLYVTNEAGGGSQALPQLWVFAPTRNAAAVGLGSHLYLTFPAPIVAGTGNLTLVGSGGDTRTIAVTDAAQVSISGNTVKINPTADLTPGTTYSVQYASGVLKEVSGLATQAVSSAQTLAFTSVADTTAPVLSTSLPVNNAIDVAANANITLTFSEAVRLGSGVAATFTVTNGSDDVRVLRASDSSQVSVSGNTVTLNPTGDLRTGTAYSVLVSSVAITDLSANAFTGISASNLVAFSTLGAGPVVTPRLLITEVNSSASGGDFFELYNYGASAVDLTGWKWDDDSASNTDAASATFPAVSIPAGGRLLVVASTDVAVFRTAWGLAGTVPAVAFGGPGLGGGDAVVVFNAAGRVMASINFRGGAVITATDGTVIAPATAAPGSTANFPSHAGIAFGGGTTASSAVWDGVSTSAPAYRAAAVNVNGGFSQPAASATVGSPGV